MVERRSAKRYPVAYPLEADFGHEPAAMNMIDLSKSGVAFAHKEDLKKDLGLEISLFLKNRMFRLKAMVVRASKLKGGDYSVGARFVDPPAEFVPLLEKEIEEIVQHHRERRLYQHDDISLTHASREYLGI